MSYSKTKQDILDKLHFTAKGHRYTLDGARILSVTQVIDKYLPYNGIGESILEEARLRGNLVHKLTAMHDMGEPFNQSDVEEAGLEGYLSAWQDAKRDLQMVVVGVEERCYHRKYRYTGTVDRTAWVTIKGKTSFDVLDIKSGSVEPEYAWQTAAYMMALNDGRVGDKIVGRHLVQLFPNGKYKLHTHDDRADCDAFVAALTLAMWRMKYARKP